MWICDGKEISMSVTYESVLKDVVILVTLPKWMHKYFQGNSEENHYENLKLFKMMRLDNCSYQDIL